MLTDDDRRCPDGPPTYPTPNGSKFPTPTVQNSPADRGRTAAAIWPSTGLVTDLLGCDGFATPEGNPPKTGSFIGLRLIGRYLSAWRRSNAPENWPAATGQRQITPGYPFALIKLSRVFRHFEAADEVGIARHSAHLLADAIGLFRRQKRRPFVDEFLPHVVDEFLPHGLFALNALRESKIRPALLGRSRRLLRDPMTYGVDVQIRDCLRLRRPNGDP